MGQLEEEKGALGEQLAQARQQLEACRADNIALYEKVGRCLCHLLLLGLVCMPCHHACAAAWARAAARAGPVH